MKLPEAPRTFTAWGGTSCDAVSLAVRPIELSELEPATAGKESTRAAAASIAMVERGAVTAPRVAISLWLKCSHASTFG